MSRRQPIPYQGAVILPVQAVPVVTGRRDEAPVSTCGEIYASPILRESACDGKLQESFDMAIRPKNRPA